MENPLQMLSQVVRILERHEITYVLVGSLAGSMHGAQSPTTNISILADIKPEHVRPLLDALNESFYVDDQAAQKAVEQRQSFNATTFDSEFKVDIVIPKGDEFARKQFERRERRKIPGSGHFVNVASAADTILERLRRHRDGDEVSAHWSDVQEILGVTDFSLEFEYLRDWSDRLGVRDLLDRALTSAKDRSSSRDNP